MPCPSIQKDPTSTLTPLRLPCVSTSWLWVTHSVPGRAPSLGCAVQRQPEAGHCRHLAAWAWPSAPRGLPARPDSAAIANAATTRLARRGPFLRAAWAPFAPSIRTPMPSGKLSGSGWPGPRSTRALEAAPLSKHGWEWEAWRRRDVPRRKPALLHLCWQPPEETD